MQEFVSAKKEKAIVDIEGKKYIIKTPSLAQSTKLVESLAKNDKDTKAQSDIMIEFLCELGSIPKDELMKIDNDLFNDLFSYVISSKKN